MLQDDQDMASVGSSYFDRRKAGFPFSVFGYEVMFELILAGQHGHGIVGVRFRANRATEGVKLKRRVSYHTK